MPTEESRHSMRILVVGAGAVGGYFGACLHRAGRDVTFLVRPTTHAEITQNGLRIESVGGPFTVRPALIQHASEMEAADLVILATKCYDLTPALDAVAPLVARGALVLTLQNGVDSEERARAYFGRDCVVAGVAYITARLARPGVIEHFRRGILTLGEWSGGISPRVTELHALLSGAGFPCHLTDRMRATKWEKLCWNATFNPLSVILDAPIWVVLDSPPLLSIVRAGIAEVAAVAAAEGVSLSPKVADETIAVSASFRDFYTSMYEDYTHGKPTEIDALNGGLAQRGRQHGVPTPTHDLLHALIVGLQNRRQARSNV
jgi:2-dehydropantoate 2-reductase